MSQIQQTTITNHNFLFFAGHPSVPLMDVIYFVLWQNETLFCLSVLQYITIPCVYHNSLLSSITVSHCEQFFTLRSNMYICIQLFTEPTPAELGTTNTRIRTASPFLEAFFILREVPPILPARAVLELVM